MSKPAGIDIRSLEMIHNIKIYGSEALRKETERVEEINDEIRNLLDDMVETMLDAPGVGLAGPQIGVNKMLFVFGTEEDNIKKVINPEILEFSEKMCDYEEGCLSIPGIYKKVERPEKIKVKYQTESGEEVTEELEGMFARIFQHEYDHLFGELFVDKIGPVGKRLISKKLQKLKKLSNRM